MQVVIQKIYKELHINITRITNDIFFFFNYKAEFELIIIHQHDSVYLLSLLPIITGI